jgi:hypothetical protein
MASCTATASGWKGATRIPDPPVPGALEFVVGALERFQVAILSSRSHQWFGRYAMKRWLRKHLIATAGFDFSDTPEWWATASAHDGLRRWSRGMTRCAWAAENVVREIMWPLHKPSAMVTIDDRALTFTGRWPALDELHAFQPWNKRRTAA